MSNNEPVTGGDQTSLTGFQGGRTAEVMIVDDSPENIALLSKILCDEYQLAVAISGEKALQMLGAGRQPDLILLDVTMPGMDGFEVKRRLLLMPQVAGIPVIFISGKSGFDDLRTGLELGAVDYVSKPFDVSLLKIRIRNQIAVRQNHDRVCARLVAAEAELGLLRQEVERASEQVIRGLSALAVWHDDLAGPHIECSGRMVAALAAELKRSSPRHGNMPDAYLRGISLCATLHDAGMLEVPHQVRNKPGALDEAEWDLVRLHPGRGWKIIEKACSDGGVTAELADIARNVCLYHHERWDGGGYPHGLSGTHIPFAARLVAVVDAYDAMTSVRSYRSALTHEQAVKEIMSQSGAAYDPDICAAFLTVSADLQQIALTHRQQACSPWQSTVPT